MNEVHKYLKFIEIQKQCQVQNFIQLYTSYKPAANVVYNKHFVRTALHLKILNTFPWRRHSSRLGGGMVGVPVEILWDLENFLKGTIVMHGLLSTDPYV